MMMGARYVLAVGALLLWAFSASAGQLTVFAAASLKTALEDVSRVWENKSGHTVVHSFAASSSLARQISFGAPADIYISANKNWVDYLDQEGLLITGTRFDVLGNRLVLIGHAPQNIGPLANFDLAGAMGDEHLAMALVDAVPAGQYGKAALQYFEQWQGIASKVAQTDNVRAALTLVALGEAPMGIVYATDALAEPRVHVLAVFPENSHPAIVYPAVAVSRSPLTLDYLGFLRSEVAQTIFRGHGFNMVTPS